MEKQKVAEKEAETLKKRAVSDAEKDAKVSEILMTQRVREQESIKRQQEIQNEIFLAKERSLTDAAFYRFVGTFNLKFLTGLNTIWKLLFHQSADVDFSSHNAYLLILYCLYFLESEILLVFRISEEIHDTICEIVMFFVRAQFHS